MEQKSAADGAYEIPPEFSAGDFRPLTEEGLAAVLKVEQASNPHPWSEASFRQELGNPASRIQVLWCGDDAAGFICYHVLLDEMSILNLATGPRFRRRGLARLLLSRALADASDRGATKAFLEVRKGNGGAISLYDSFGFTIQGCRKGYYADGEDALIMGKIFSSCLEEYL